MSVALIILGPVIAVPSFAAWAIGYVSTHTKGIGYLPGQHDGITRCLDRLAMIAMFGIAMTAAGFLVR